MTTTAPDILKKIIVHKQEEVIAAKSAASMAELTVRIRDLEDIHGGLSGISVRRRLRTGPPSLLKSKRAPPAKV